MNGSQLASRWLSGTIPLERRRLITWIVVALFAAGLGYFAFRAYLNPELLLQFTNALHC